MENSKKFNKKNIIITAALICIVAIIIVAVLLSSGNKTIFNDLENISENYAVASPREDKPIMYIKNGALLVKPADGDGDAVKLSDNLCAGDVLESSSVYINLVKQSKTTESAYFINNYSKSEYKGDLFVTTDYETSTPVDTGVIVENGYDYLKMSDDGKTVVYMKNLVNTDDELYADLYYKSENLSESILIASDLYGMQTDYVVSPDGQYIAAYSEYNSEKDSGGLMILKVSTEPKKLVLENTSNVKLVSVTNDGKLIFTSISTDADGNKVKESVSIINYDDMQTKNYGEDIDSQNVFVSDKSDKIVYLDYSDESISAYSASYNSDPKLITDNYYGFTALDVENECYMYAQAAGDEKYTAAKKVYLKTPSNDSPLLLSDKISIPSDVKQSADYKIIYYLADSSLYVTELSDTGLSAPEKIAENVHEFKISQGGNSVIFDTDYDETSKISNLKAYTRKSKKVSDVAENVKLEYSNLSVDGLAVVYADGLLTGQNNTFTASLKHYNLYGKAKTTILSDYASMMLYYYDQYLASTTDDTIISRNRYYVRSGNSVLFYTEVGEDCKSGNLILFKDGKDTVVDSDVMAVLFE